MAELNPNAKKWVRALRSGKYRQGTNYLERDGRFCCLGVACDLAVKAGVRVKRREVGGFVASYAKERQSLPPTVRKWLGLGGVSGDMEDDSSLAEINDDGKSFSEIADLIESQPEGLFA